MGRRCWLSDGRLAGVETFIARILLEGEIEHLFLTMTTFIFKFTTQMNGKTS